MLPKLKRIARGDRNVVRIMSHKLMASTLRLNPNPRVRIWYPSGWNTSGPVA